MKPETVLNRVLRDPHLKLRWTNPKLVSLYERPVMLAVCELVANSHLPGIWAPNAVMDGEEPLLSKLARHLQAIGDEEGIGRALERLALLGFMEVTKDKCIVIRSAVVDVTSSTAANNGSMSIGAKRKHESDASYAARLKTHQAKVRAERAQTEMLFVTRGPGPIAGERVAGQDLADVLRASFAVVPGAPGLSETVTQDVPKCPMSAVGWVMPDANPVSPDLAAAAALDSIDSLKAAAASSSVPPRDAPENPGNNPASNPAGNLTPIPKPDLATELANLAAERLGWAKPHRKAASGSFRTYLFGYSAEQIRDQIDVASAPGHPTVYSAKWFGPRLRDVYGAPGHRAVQAASAVPTAASKAPRSFSKHLAAVAKHPKWSFLGTGGQFELARVLEAMDLPDGPERAGTLGELRRQYDSAWERVAEEHPELLEMEASEVIPPARKAG